MNKTEAVCGTLERILAGCGENDPEKIRAILNEGFAAYRQGRGEGFRLLVCGGRDFDEVPYMWEVLDKADRYWAPVGGIGFIIEGANRQDKVGGGFTGADYWANQWCMARGKRPLRYPAMWSQHGKAAGPLRNQQMLDQGRPDGVIAFEGGAGTRNMVTLARAAGVRVWER